MRSVIAFTFAALIFSSCARQGDSDAASSAQEIGSARSPSASDTLASAGRLDPHRHGAGEALHLVDITWGRLADVHAQVAGSPEPELVARDLVIGESIASDRADFEVETDPITGTTRVTILHPRASAQFARALAELESGLVPIAEKSLDPAELPPWSVVPRNAAIVARFDDLLDEATIPGSIQVHVGAPAAAAHPTRVFADAHHGGYADRDGDGNLEFHPTRVIIDLAVSELEARAGADAVQVASPLGLPASANDSLANAALRLATQSKPHLANLAGHALDPRANGSVADGNHGLDVVRAFRSGGSDDLFEGLLADTEPPRIVGQQAITLTSVAPDPNGGPNDFLVDLAFLVPACAQSAARRDVIETANAVALVTQASGAPVAGTLANVHVRAIAGSLATGPAQFRSPFDPLADAGQEACFVEFVPPPISPPARGVSPSAQIRVRFSEPIDPASADAFSGLVLAREIAPDSPDDYVAGQVSASAGLDTLTLVPLLSLEHVQGQGERRFLDVRSAIRDLAGLPLAAELADVSFSLDPAAPTASTGDYVLHFDSADEDGNGAPEIRGQFLYDFAAGVIRPRPVVHFPAVIDRNQPIIARMIPFANGVQTPLSPLGSKLHSLWRYCDAGLSLTDETYFNLDVEGMAWAPRQGSVVADSFSLFEISLAHAKFLPDEAIDPLSLLPMYPGSGLVSTYALNQLSPTNDPLQVVHPRQLGYTINPADLFVAATGTVLMPWPLNRGIPPSQFQYYTWRDTAIAELGAPNGAGAELKMIANITGQPNIAGVPYPTNRVPTVGLPLLMEFKCFPDAGAIGLNRFDISLAVNSSARPNFRAFSTGGINVSGQAITIDPDAQLIASGGFNPNSTPPGAVTMPSDNSFYIGELDLVIRVNRIHGVWISTQTALGAVFAPTVAFAPSSADQPAGTQIRFAWRGATAVSVLVQQDANALDAYGNPLDPGSTVLYLNNDRTWKSSISQIDGALFAQPRITLISNAESGERPELNGFGIAWTR